ncbi:beta subunit of phenylalanine-tRNA ligase [Hamiltosporidium tvaerminnensis]|uniref:phenylalanine--tRNA ligase n=1 Tax=Hamiltosporidium tvaerminnensis TaxID=1176355 RepID=A0A4Q9LSI5_9MICR|nr:beta subunit of phenylalanine-tRNA ligase [Hamiltosporidium tvaerminnensis]
MPSISVKHDEISSYLNLDPTGETLSDLLFSYGLELEETISDPLTYKIDIPANRYDLLTPHLLSKALLSFLSKKKFEDLKIKNSSTHLTVSKTCRPFIACAIVRNIKFTETLFTNILEFQEKLHLSLCRHRTLAAIGIHDLDKTTPPFFYTEENPEDIKFTPLFSDTPMYASDLVSNPNFKHTHHLTEMSFFPVLKDSKQIISLPPVINCDETKISMNTKNLFIEVTGNDFNRVNTTLKLICYFFSEFEIEKVKILHAEKMRSKTKNCYEILGFKSGILDKPMADESINHEGLRNGEESTVNIPSNDSTTNEISNNAISSNAISNNAISNNAITNNNLSNQTQKMPFSIETPIFFNRKFSVSIVSVEKELGISINIYMLKVLLEKMMHFVTIEDNCLEVVVPDIRTDVLHFCDLIEDIAIAFGYENVPIKNVDFVSIGKEFGLNKFSDKIRNLMANCGFTEVLTMTLLSKKECYALIEIGSQFSRSKTNLDKIIPTVLSNPQSSECECVRISLLPGILKSIQNNKHLSVPFKLFECSDCVITGLNVRFLCGVYCGVVSGFEEIVGAISFILKKVDLDYNYREERSKRYFEKRGGAIYIAGVKVGTFGVVDPEFCSLFGVDFVVSSFEIDVEKIYAFFIEKNK